MKYIIRADHADLKATLILMLLAAVTGSRFIQLAYLLALFDQFLFLLLRIFTPREKRPKDPE